MFTKRHRILYVDDDQDNCRMMKAWLSNRNYRYDVSAVCSAEDAISLIADTRFDLHILDYCLPMMSGAELCRFIRRRRFPHTDTDLQRLGSGR